MCSADLGYVTAAGVMGMSRLYGFTWVSWYSGVSLCVIKDESPPTAFVKHVEIAELGLLPMISELPCPYKTRDV